MTRDNYLHGYCIECGLPQWQDCMCGLSSSDSDDEYERQRYSLGYVPGKYYDDIGINVRDFAIPYINTDDWEHFHWSKYPETGSENPYTEIHWNMFNINQYSLNPDYRENRLASIYDNQTHLDNLFWENYGDDENPDLYISFGRYLTFIKWFITSPHFTFYMETNPNPNFLKYLEISNEMGNYFLDKVAERRNQGLVPVPLPECWNQHVDESYTLAEDLFTQTIMENKRIWTSLHRIQLWMKNRIQRRNTIYKGYAFNHFQKTN